MENNNWLDLLSGTTQLQKVMDVNERTERYGLSLTEEDAMRLLAERKEVLREKQRVEFGEGILPKLIDAFCDSPYISQSNYVETIIELQEIFYEYKNECMDQFTDEELIDYMVEAFNGVCQGSTEFLEDTALDEMARVIREQGEEFLFEYRRRRMIEDDDEM